MITLGQEIKYIWRSSWSLVKFLYIAIRYYAMFFLLINSFVNTDLVSSVQFCDHYWSFRTWGSNVLMPMVDALIIIRIYALYGRSRKMGLLLVAFWFIQVIGGFTLLGFAFKVSDDPVQFPPSNNNATTCFPMDNPPNHELAFCYWMVLSAFQAAYFAITTFRLGFVQTFGFSMTPLLSIFLRDGAGYFFIILAVNLLNAFFDVIGTNSRMLELGGLSWLVSVSSITACRLILNIRNVATTFQTTGTGTVTSADLRVVGILNSDDAENEPPDSPFNTLPR